jgi:hypothetical protein
MNSFIFWDITPCGALKANLHLNVNQAGNQFEAKKIKSSTLKMKAVCSSETSWTFAVLYGVISQKIAFFIIAAVRILRPTEFGIV